MQLEERSDLRIEPNLGGALAQAPPPGDGNPGDDCRNVDRHENGVKDDPRSQHGHTARVR